MKRIGTMNIKDILRYRHDHALSRSQIAAAAGVSTGTVSHVLARAEAAGLSWPLPPGLDDEALRARLYAVADHGSDRVQPDWAAILEDLEAPRKRRRTRLTRRQLWSEYRDEALAQGGKAYTYSRFCALLKERRQGRPGQAQARFPLRAGSLRHGRLLRQDPERAQRPRREGCGDLRCRCCPTRTRSTPRRCPTRACGTGRWRTAVPSRRLVACPSAGSSTTSRLASPGRTARSLSSIPASASSARHYGLAVLPARSGRATDKATAEAAVGVVQTRIPARAAP